MTKSTTKSRCLLSVGKSTMEFHCDIALHVVISLDPQEGGRWKRQHGERRSKRYAVVPHCDSSKNYLLVLAGHGLAKHLQEEGHYELENLLAGRHALLHVQVNLVNDHEPKHTSACLPAEHHSEVGMFCKELGRGEEEHDGRCDRVKDCC